MYSWANWFFLIGFVCPIIQYIIARRWPKSMARYIFFPAFFGVTGMIPPATMFQLLCYISCGLFFNSFIRGRYFGWWERYTYTISGALDVGNALCLILYALCLGLTGASLPSWWGNSGFADTLDANGMATTYTVGVNGTISDIKSWS